MNKKNILKIILYIFCFLQIIDYETVYAVLQARGDINTNASSGTSVIYDGKWDTNIDTFAFRVTLVDKNGKKVNNTKSIDYRYSGCYNTDNRVKQESYNKNIKYDYKYGENEGNYDSYTANLVNKQYCSYDYTNFVKDFTQVIKTRSKKFDMYTSTPTGEEKFTTDFTTMFLYHSGYLKRNSDEKYFDIDDMHWFDRKMEIQDAPYYLLIEPKFSFSYGSYTSEGTSKEIISYFLYDIKAQPYFSTAAFKYTLAMGMHTNVDDARKIGFERITKDQNQITIYNGTINPDYTDKEFKAIVSDEYGFGVGVLQLNDIISKIEIAKDIYFSKNLCNETASENKTNKISFYMNNNFSEEIFEQLIKAGYKYQKYDSVNSEIYCYDDVTYDFSNIINSLNKTTVKTSTYSVIPTGTITVNRHCLVNSPDVEYETAKKTFLDIFKEYEKQEIPLNVYNNMVNLKKTNIDIVNDESNIKYVPGNKKRGIYNTTATITFGYTENDSKVYVTKNYGDGTAYVDLSNVTFGYSNDLKNQVQDGQVYTHGKYTFTTHVTSSGDSMKCPFKTTVENLDTSDLIKFRTISLDNPFPSRDATSRLPGSNWLGKDNFVGTYINNNRGVQGSAVYNKEPIYTITLTPSQMVKIREYNKKHSYNDLDLNCVGENNTSCLSNFLRTTINEENIKGSCMINSDNIIKDPNHIGQYDMQKVVETITETNEKGNPFKLNETNSMYDFNKDGVLSLRDAYIYDNAEKTTNYYTCADKTYENSGYVKEVSINE